MRVIALFLFGALLPLSANAAAAPDEASCMLRLARAQLAQTRWRHLVLEPEVLFSGSLAGPKSYTIYSESRTTTPKNHKIQFRALWNPSPAGNCDFILNTPFTVTSSQRETILEWRNARDILNFTELDPARFALIPEAGPEIPSFAAFNAEREFTRAGRSVQTPLLTYDPEGRVQVTMENLRALAEHGILAAGEIGAVVGIQRYFRPTKMGGRFLRRTTQLAFVLDAGNRLYAVIGQGQNPSYVPLAPIAEIALEGAGVALDRFLHSVVIQGSVRPPVAYTERFYERN